MKEAVIILLLGVMLLATYMLFKNLKKRYLHKLAMSNLPAYLAEAKETHWDISELDNEEFVNSNIGDSIVKERLRKLLGDKYDANGLLVAAVFDFHNTQYKVSAVFSLASATINGLPTDPKIIASDILAMSGYAKTNIVSAKFAFNGGVCQR